MPGYDRKIDPLTGDYVDAPGGAYAETLTIQPQLYHQLRTPRGQWWGDPDAGSDLYLIKQLDKGTLVFAKDATSSALRPFVEAGQARDLRVEATGSELGRLSLEVAITDTTTGEPLDDIVSIGEG